MPRTIDDYYVIDDSLSRNESVVNLVRLMGVSYSLKTGERIECASHTPQKPQQIYVAPVNDVWLGLWPMQGPVHQIYYNPRLEENFEKGILRVTRYFDHDEQGRAMVSLRLTENQRQLRRLGLEQLLRGHAISLYLQPK
jgi:hypothetical protein